MPRLLNKSTVIAAFSSLILGVSIYPAVAVSYQVSILSGQRDIGDFANPLGVAVSPDGTVFIADTDHFKIKKVVNGGVSDFATIIPKDYANTNDSFCGLALSYQNNQNVLWASDCANSKVYAYGSDGRLLRTFAIKLDFKSSCDNCRDWGGGIAIYDRGGSFNGSVFLSDEYNHVILKLDQSTGVTTVYAGMPGVRGGINGKATESTFAVPRGLATDSKGNLYVADLGNSAIRKISPDGVTSTILSYTNCITGVAVDSFDQVFGVTEQWCGPSIIKVGKGKVFDDSKSINSSLNGAIIGQIKFSVQSAFAIASKGNSPSNNMYIADYANHSVKIFSPEGQFLGKIGPEDSYGVTGEGTSNELYLHPSQTFPISDGSYLVSDNFTIRHVSSTGEILKVTRLDKGCYYSGGVAITPDGTFFCSSGNTVLARFPNGNWTTIGNATAGRVDGTSSIARFSSPHGLAIYQGSVYVGDVGNRQIRQITRVPNSSEFEVKTVLGTGVWTSSPDVQPRDKVSFAAPAKLTIDGLGNLYIADGGVDSILKTSLVQNTDVTRIARGFGSWPSSMTSDGENTIYMSTYGGRIFKIRSNILSLVAGNGYGNQVGSSESALFSSPNGLSINLDGDLIVADRGNNQIKKIATQTSPSKNILSASVVATYMGQSSIPQAGLTSQQEENIENKVKLTNKTGLIFKTYLSKGDSQARSMNNLQLCDVSIVKRLDFRLGNTVPISTPYCKTGRSLLTFKGFITWPGSGKQLRTISTSANGGSYVKIGDQVVVDKWNSSGGISSNPYNKSSTLTLKGGKQYPIEIWYLGPQSGTDLVIFTYWSTVASGDRSTAEVISEKYLAPTKQEGDNPVALPVKASSPKITVNLNFINITVKVPASASSIKLFAPEFGVTAANPIVGTISNGLANFEVSLNSKYAGKKGDLQIVTGNAVGDSSPLKVPVTVPKIANKPAPKVTPSARPQEVQKQPEVSCLKGGIERTFEGASCPPGYTKA